MSMSMIMTMTTTRMRMRMRMRRIWMRMMMRRSTTTMTTMTVLVVVVVFAAGMTSEKTRQWCVDMRGKNGIYVHFAFPLGSFHRPGRWNKNSSFISFCESFWGSLLVSSHCWSYCMGQRMQRFAVRLSMRPASARPGEISISDLLCSLYSNRW